jgi:RluA family pseudouridine synthase
VTLRTYHLTCRVDAYRDGWTLLRFLTHRFRYHPAELWRVRVEEGIVRVNGVTAAADTVLRTGDRVLYTIRHAEPDVDFTYEVLHEDDDLLAVSKSGNLPVHAGGKYIRNTLIAVLRERWGPELRLAHRLDRETSGVVLLAKNVAAARALEREFHARRVRKRYVAVLRGETPAEWTVDAPIARREGPVPPYFRVVDAAGKPSVTRFSRLVVAAGPAGPLSLVAVEPVSGRTNQIRVHAAHAGYPVLGDKIYGVPEALARDFVARGETPELLAAAGAPRHLLHCAFLALAHAATGEPWECRAPRPADIAGLFPE